MYTRLSSYAEKADSMKGRYWLNQTDHTTNIRYSVPWKKNKNKQAANDLLLQAS